MNIKGIALAAFLSVGMTAIAQETQTQNQDIDYGVTYVEPLFEYPIAPEELSDFTAKCDWLAENFWNPLDVKNQNAVDQLKLNHAFQVYATTAQYAAKDKVNAALDKLLKNIQKNPTLLVQFTKAAEETIYGPRAEVWIDELYVKILKSALASKKFPKTRRARYESQLKQLENTLVGGIPAMFEFKRANGDDARYFPMSTPTIIIFGDPGCEDCRMACLRLETNVAFNKAVNDGKLNVLYIIPDADEGWEKEVTGYPKTWAVGASDTVAEIYDLRDIPDIYLIDADGTIIAKHIGVMTAIQKSLELIN